MTNDGSNISVVDLLMPLLRAGVKPIQGVTSGMPDRGYGYRHNTNPKQPKGTGFFGMLASLANPQDFSSEITIPKADNSGEQPQMVPDLSHRELVSLLVGSKDFRESIIRKSDNSTNIRKLQNKEPFIGEGEKQVMTPEIIPGTSMTILDIIQNAIIRSK